SSAFPGAFAPVWLKSAPDAGATCNRQPHDSALFSDGGIFDNNPIDLAAGIYDETIWKNPRTPDANSLLLFIDPDRLSGRLGQATPPHRAAVAVSTGVAGAGCPSHPAHRRRPDRPATRRRGPWAATRALQAGRRAVRQRTVPLRGPDRRSPVPRRLSHHAGAL